MSDFGSPVATGIDPQQGFKTISSMLGIKQQQQALQGQQSHNQSLAAQASIDVRGAQEQSRLAAIPWDSFQKPDGSYDVDTARKVALRVAPTTGAAFADRLNATAESGAKAKEAFLGLNQDYQQTIRAGLGAWAADPKADISSLATQADLAKKNAPAAQRDQVSQVIDHTLQAITGPDVLSGQPKSLAQQKAAALAYTRSGLSNSEVAGSGGLATPEPITQQRAGPGGVTVAQPATVNRMTGAQTPVGGAYSQGIAPNQTPGYLASASRASSGAAARATGTAGSDIDRSNEVASTQQQSAAAIPLTERIDQLSRDINSGKVAKMISETGNYFGISSINEARSQLNKDLGQVKGLAVSKAGSDSRAATILEGYPTDTTPESTIHAAMDYIRGTARQNLARGKLLNQYQQSDPEGLRGFQAADNVLGGTTNPLMHEYLALKPADQAGFYRRNFSTPQQAQEFKDQVTALKKHSRVFDSK